MQPERYELRCPLGDGALVIEEVVTQSAEGYGPLPTIEVGPLCFQDASGQKQIIAKLSDICALAEANGGDIVSSVLANPGQFARLICLAASLGTSVLFPTWRYEIMQLRIDLAASRPRVEDSCLKFAVVDTRKLPGALREIAINLKTMQLSTQDIGVV